MLWKGQQRILLADKQVRGEPITIENFVIDTINTIINQLPGNQIFR